MATEKSEILYVRVTPDTRRHLERLQKALRAAGFAAGISDAVRYAIAQAPAPVSAQGQERVS